MSRQRLTQTIADYQMLIDTHLQQYLDYLSTQASTSTMSIYRAMSYSLFAKGKKVRPILLLATCRSLQGNVDKAIPFACALEMIHTYSLIHDDLPAMDDDDYRRGRLTNHKVFGEALGILAGDALLNLAYETMTQACIRDFRPETLQAMQNIAQSAGLYGMVGGQSVDIESENKSIDEETLLYIHRHKTAALISAALISGGWIAGASTKTIACLEIVGQSLGLAFQIQDDILDITATPEELGKPINSDEKNKKSTYISLLGIERAQVKMTELFQSAVDLLKSELIHDEFLLAYVEFLMDRRH